MQRLQLLLQLVGGLGFLFWTMIITLAALSIGPGPPVNPISGYPKLLAIIGPLIGFVFCVIAAARKPSDFMFVLGVAVHTIFVIGIYHIHTRTDGGFLVTPFLSLGPILWIAFFISARCTRFMPNRATESN